MHDISRFKSALSGYDETYLSEGAVLLFPLHQVKQGKLFFEPATRYILYVRVYISYATMSHSDATGIDIYANHGYIQYETKI